MKRILKKGLKKFDAHFPEKEKEARLALVLSAVITIIVSILMFCWIYTNPPATQETKTSLEKQSMAVQKLLEENYNNEQATKIIISFEIDEYKIVDIYDKEMVKISSYRSDGNSYMILALVVTMFLILGLGPMFF